MSISAHRFKENSTIRHWSSAAQFIHTWSNSNLKIGTKKKSSIIKTTIRKKYLFFNDRFNRIRHKYHLFNLNVCYHVTSHVSTLTQNTIWSLIWEILSDHRIAFGQISSLNLALQRKINVKQFMLITPMKLTNLPSLRIEYRACHSFNPTNRGKIVARILNRLYFLLAKAWSQSGLALINLQQR